MFQVIERFKKRRYDVGEIGMKGIAVVSKAKETSHNICVQLRQLLGERMTVEDYCIDYGIHTDFKDQLVVITSHLLKNYLLSRLHPDTRYVVARRSINYNFLSKLIAIPSGTEVLLINDVEETCIETIEQLKELGINHIHYYPYYLGIKEYKNLELAVTPGETHLAPSCVKEIIDIGTRLIDITTLVEILMHTGSLGEKGNLISSQFVRNIIDLSKQYNKVANEATELKNLFQTIVENSSDGIVYLNALGTISATNDVFLSFIERTMDLTKDKNINEVLPELKDLMEDRTESQILKLQGRKLVATKVDVKREEKVLGCLVTIKDATEIQNLEHELRRKMRKQEHNAKYRFRDIIGESEIMGRTIRLSKKLAQSDSTILVQGESGTGKEFFAQAIHNASGRSQGPFVPVNFAALPATLLESELFGYEEGAFTGARKGGKPGLFEESHGGTIFLDEIGDAPMELQVRLLRVLQEKEVRRVGGTKTIPIDVRVISATNKELSQLVREGAFRKDLYYRLNVLTLHLPALRERKEDIPILLEIYLSRYSHKKIPLRDFFSKEALDFLLNYEWGGNVRELVNVVEYLVHVREEGSLIQIEDLPAYIINEVGIREMHAVTLSRGVEEVYPEMKDVRTWILKKAWETHGVGRRKLALMAEDEGMDLTEGKIRRLMGQLEEEGFLALCPGTKGAVVTKEGIELLRKK